MAQQVKDLALLLLWLGSLLWHGFDPYSTCYEYGPKKKKPFANSQTKTCTGKVLAALVTIDNRWI